MSMPFCKSGGQGGTKKGNLAGENVREAAPRRKRLDEEGGEPLDQKQVDWLIGLATDNSVELFHTDNHTTLAGSREPPASDIGSGSRVEPAPAKTMSVPEAGRVLGLSRNAAYAAARRGELPVLRFGKKLRVPVCRLERLLEGSK
jgi:excisionase family DNA binding protein